MLPLAGIRVISTVRLRMEFAVARLPRLSVKPRLSDWLAPANRRNIEPVIRKTCF